MLHLIRTAQHTGTTSCSHLSLTRKDIFGTFKPLEKRIFVFSLFPATLYNEIKIDTMLENDAFFLSNRITGD